MCSVRLRTTFLPAVLGVAASVLLSEVVAVALAVAVVPVAAAAEPPAPVGVSGEQIRAILVRVAQEKDVPALGAAVVKRDEVILAVTGVRKRGTAAAVTPADCWHLGSNTKAMTAYLLARLIEQQRLNYDATLATLLPDMKDELHNGYRDTTLAELLRHRSGLPANLGGLGGWFRISPTLPLRQQRAQVLQEVLRAAPEKPRGQFEYSNVGYVVAGHLAERVANSTWEDLLRREMFEPLQMTTAGFGPPGNEAVVDQPWPHTSDGQPRSPASRLADNPPVMGPAGRVHASLGDWAKFIQDLLRGAAGTGGLLPAAAYQPLLNPVPGESYTVGGWSRRLSPRGPVLVHDGSNTLNYCSAVLFPESGCAVLVVCNQGGPAALEAVKIACREVIQLLLPPP